MRVVFVFVVCFTLNACESMMRKSLDPGEGEFEYIEKLEHSEVDKAYIRMMEWLSLQYVSAKTVVHLASEKHGKIVLKAKHTHKDPFYGLLRISYIMNISIKDNTARFRYKIGEAETHTGMYKGYPTKEIIKSMEMIFVSDTNKMVAAANDKF